MTTAAWPATLPQCPLLELSEQRQRHIVAFAPEVGFPGMRRRSTAVVTLTSMNFKMTSTQLQIFYTFYETTLFDGSLPFTWSGSTWVFDGKESPRIDRMTAKTSRVSFSLLRLP